MRAAIITVSSSKAGGEGIDESGPALASVARSFGAEIVGAEVIADDRHLIEACLRRWADEPGCELILTSGGTGVAPSDVTPDATAAVIEREVPGIGEAIRAASRPHTPNWMLSRGIAGIRGRTLIVNFPGSPRSIQQTGPAIAEVLPHALKLIAGRPVRH